MAPFAVPLTFFRRSLFCPRLFLLDNREPLVRGDAIVDLLSGEGLGRGPKTAVPLSKGDTRILRIGE